MTADGLPERNPVTLRWAVRLLLGESVGLALLTLYLVFRSVTQKVTATGMAFSTDGYLALMTVLFVAVGVALSRRRRWARGPAIVLQMLQMPIGWTMLTTGLPLVGGPLFALGLAGAVLLLAPQTRVALGVK